MRTVWKYPIPWTIKNDVIICSVPQGSKPLTIRLKKEADDYGTVEKLCAWFEVDTDKPMTNVEIYHVATGQEIPNGAIYVATEMNRAGDGVSHFYWKPICQTGLMKT